MSCFCLQGAPSAEGRMPTSRRIGRGWCCCATAALGRCMGGTGRRRGRRATGQLAPVGAFVVGPGSAGGKHGGGGRGDAGGEQPLVFGPGGAAGARPDGGPLAGGGGGAHRGAWEGREAGGAPGTPRGGGGV